MAITWPSKSALLLIQVQHQYFLFAILWEMCDIYGTLFLIQAIIYSDENQKETVFNIFS